MNAAIIGQMFGNRYTPIIENVPWPFVGSGSFTYIQGVQNNPVSTESSQSVTLTGVTTRSLIVAAFKSEAAFRSILHADDGTSTMSLDLETEQANGDNRIVLAYLTASKATGTVTYTLYRTGAVSFCTSMAMEFSSSGLIAFDTGSGNQDNVGATAISSSNVSTTQPVSLVLGAYAQYTAATLSSPRISGTLAEVSVPAVPVASVPVLWFRTYNQTLTNVSASATLSTAGAYAMRILALKATGV